MKPGETICTAPKRLETSKHGIFYLFHLSLIYVGNLVNKKGGFPASKCLTKCLTGSLFRSGFSVFGFWLFDVFFIFVRTNENAVKAMRITYAEDPFCRFHPLLPGRARKLVRRPDIAVLVEMGVKSPGRDDHRMPLYNRHSFEKSRSFGINF